MNILQSSRDPEAIVCPKSKLKLLQYKLAEAERIIGGGVKLISCDITKEKHIGPTDIVLLREDLRCAYPIVDDIPILIAPEMLTVDGNLLDCNLSDVKYCEAYKEMKFYNEVASRNVENLKNSEGFKILEPILKNKYHSSKLFPEPANIWLDATYDCIAQHDAYEYIAPVEGKRVLQVGGMGIHAVKFLLAGAKEAWVLTPMLEEARYAVMLANAVGVGDCLNCVVGVAEELPFNSGFFDIIYVGGCLHHLVTSLALFESERVLCSGGRFTAVEPWKTPLYDLGKRMMGNREENLFGQRDNNFIESPLTTERIRSLYSIFRNATVLHHGVFTRYPLLAFCKLGIKIPLSIVWQIFKLDDVSCSIFPKLQNIMGSSVSILAEK